MSDDKFVNELTQIEEEQRALDARPLRANRTTTAVWSSTAMPTAIPGRAAAASRSGSSPPSTPAPSLMISAPMRIALLKNSDFLQHDQKRNFLG